MWTIHSEVFSIKTSVTKKAQLLKSNQSVTWSPISFNGLLQKSLRAKSMSYHPFESEIKALISSVHQDYLSTTESFAKQHDTLIA